MGFRKSALQRFGFGSVPGLVTLLENLPQDNDQSGHMSKHEISFYPSLSDSIRTQADFTYKITPAVISITDTGLGKCSVAEDSRQSCERSSTGTRAQSQSSKSSAGTEKGFGTEFGGIAKPHPYSPCRKPMSEKRQETCSSKRVGGTRTIAVTAMGISVEDYQQQKSSAEESRKFRVKC